MALRRLVALATASYRSGSEIRTLLYLTFDFTSILDPNLHPEGAPGEPFHIPQGVLEVSDEGGLERGRREERDGRRGRVHLDRVEDAHGPAPPARMGPPLLSPADDPVDLRGRQPPAMRRDRFEDRREHALDAPAGAGRCPHDLRPRNEPQSLRDIALEPGPIDLVSGQQIPLVEDHDAGPPRLEDVAGDPLVASGHALRDVDDQNDCIDPAQRPAGTEPAEILDLVLDLNFPTFGRPMMATPPHASSGSSRPSGRTATRASRRSPDPRPWRADTGRGSPRPNRKKSAAAGSSLGSSILFTTTSVGLPARLNDAATRASSSRGPVTPSVTRTTTSAN